MVEKFENYKCLFNIPHALVGKKALNLFLFSDKVLD